MFIIPTPDDARELRALFGGHPTVRLALAWLRLFGVDHVRNAVDELPRWQHFAEMSPREVAATLAQFVPPPADTCERCGLEVRYVLDGPDPGWWTHVDLEALLSGDAPTPPHPALPDYRDDDSNSGHGWSLDGDAGGNSGPGWPLGGVR